MYHFCITLSIKKPMAATSRIILSVDKSKEQAFLEMLKLFDFVKIETTQDVLERYIQNAPFDVPLSEEEIIAEVMEERYGYQKKDD